MGRDRTREWQVASFRGDAASEGHVFLHSQPGSNVMKQLIAVLVAATFSLAALAQGAAPGTASSAPAASASTPAPAKTEAKKTKKKKSKKQHSGEAKAPAAAPAK